MSVQGMPEVIIMLERVQGLVSIDQTKALVQSILFQHGFGSAYSCAVHVVGKARIRELNRETRGVDKSTDVLSFPLHPKKDGFGDMCVGDIFICPEVIRNQAKIFLVHVKEEYIRMIAHGVLHIVGFDHDTPARAKKMFIEQETWVHTSI